MIRRATIGLCIAALLMAWCGLALAAEPDASGPQPEGAAITAAPEVDSYVLLDGAKMLLGDGRLEQARDVLAEIPADDDEPFINEELSLQRLLVVSAFLSATHQVRRQLEEISLGDSEYGRWLDDQRSEHLANYLGFAEQYLEQTAGGADLDFVRFRLPYVSKEHLFDLELYSDPEVLDPAVTNWAEGRDGLGRGLVLVQARVALVLAAAVHYDMDYAQPALDDVSERLRHGVPLDLATTLDWLADLSVGLATPDDGLVALARQCDERIDVLTAGQLWHPARERMQRRVAANYLPVRPVQAEADTLELAEAATDSGPVPGQEELLAGEESSIAPTELNTTEAEASQ